MEQTADFSSPYLTEQIIAYIGNKRRLLTLIYKALQECGIELKPGLKFFDVFSGSGVVSRFAKSLGFEVTANDWEEYSKIINEAYLCINQSDISKIFGSRKKFSGLLKKINEQPSPSSKEQFIAKYYAPHESDVSKADYKTERLFYTKENALAIDKIRNYIEENYPSSSKNKKKLSARSLLIALLIYEAATHTNTSGVFKAFHKEFGGHGKDALKRILSPIQLHEPPLIDSPYPCRVFKEDANSLVKKIGSVDIAYLDPPYNQHQYGSNYFMLNTIAKWDKVAPGLELNEKGILKEKAGIRHDWVNTRSPYCYKKEAQKYFEDLIKNLNARYIFISYSTDGIIPFETMQKICMDKGKVFIVTNEYTTYRGGKQSNSRQNTDIEFILGIDTSKKSDLNSINEIRSIFEKKKVSLLFRQKYSKEKFINLSKINPSVTICGESVNIKLGKHKLQILTDDFFTIEETEELYNLNADECERLTSILFSCSCLTKEDELEELLRRAESGKEGWVRFAKLIPGTLKKLASKKNKEVFNKWLLRVKSLMGKNPQAFNLLHHKIESVELIATARFTT